MNRQKTPNNVQLLMWCSVLYGDILNIFEGVSRISALKESDVNLKPEVFRIKD